MREVLFFEAKLKPGDKIYAWGLSDGQFAEGAVMGAGYDARWIQNDYAVYYIGEAEMLK
ncbi:MAG: hypothetical protein JNM88_00620 [Chitinophagaceae bacterium]|nr:hypothetical protein [Chitinophagaceae bacterium]